MARVSNFDRKNKQNMSTLIPGQVGGWIGVTPQHLAVYHAIASQLFDGKNIVRLGIRWIAQNSKVHKDTAARCIKDLIKAEHLEIVGQPASGTSAAVYKVTAWQFATKQKDKGNDVPKTADTADRKKCSRCDVLQDSRQINKVGICHMCSDKIRAKGEVGRILDEIGYSATNGEVWSELQASGSRCSRKAIQLAYIDLMNMHHDKATGEGTISRVGRA